MATTIPGGRYQVGDSFVDANGNAVNEPTKAEERALAQEAEAQRQAEQAAAQVLAAKDTELATLRAELAALQAAQPPAPAPAGPKADDKKGK